MSLLARPFLFQAMEKNTFLQAVLCCIHQCCISVAAALSVGMTSKKCVKPAHSDRFRVCAATASSNSLPTGGASSTASYVTSLSLDMACLSKIYTVVREIYMVCYKHEIYEVDTEYYGM